MYIVTTVGSGIKKILADRIYSMQILNDHVMETMHGMSV